MSGDDLKKIGKLVQKSKSTMPSSFNNNWNNPIKSHNGYRAVDWIDFLFHMLPLVFVPFIKSNDCKHALIKLSTALKLASQKQITEADLKKIKT